MDKIFSESPVEEKPQRLKRFFPMKQIIFVLIILVFLNMIYLDIIILQSGNVKTIEKIIQAPITQQISKNDDSFCSQACVSKINAVMAIANKPTVQMSPSPTPTKAPAVYQASSVTKEYYVPFGSGTGNSADWQDVGLQANVDSSAYGNIKNVVFEVSLHVPTGNENTAVRLYNATGNHPVWYSELDFTGNTSSVSLSSNKITLDAGNNLYKVQIKTQLQYPATIDQSRLHITSN
ncbi:MAG TPA: hypothetical protein VMR59_01645 [Patescibacteria group bacterium]|jgi:hypothetical protein|nr:hypothetical protein [Patescibacteria group bacterium]